MRKLSFILAFALLLCFKSFAEQTPFDGGSVLFPRTPDNISGTPGYTSVTLDGASEAQGSIFQAPKDGNINEICFATGTVTTGEDMDVRLESVDLATGTPSGSLVGTNTNGTLTILASDDNSFLCQTLTASATVTTGQYLATVLKNPASSFGNLQVRTFADDGISEFPYNVNFITGAWAKAATGAIIAIGYDDGTYPYLPDNYPIKSAISANSFTNLSTPDIYGIRFQVPVPTTMTGAWIWADTDGDADLLLVDSSYNEGTGTGILASWSIDSSVDRANVAGLMFFRMTSGYVLSANTWYRLIVRPTTASAVALYSYDISSTDIMTATPGGVNLQMTSAKDPTGDGSWTNVSTSQMWMGLTLKSFDKPSGTGVGFTSN